MTNDPRTDVPRSSDSHTSSAHDDQEPESGAHFGAVEGETSAVVPVMRGSPDDADDQFDPADEITPG